MAVAQQSSVYVFIKKAAMFKKLVFCLLLVSATCFGSTEGAVDEHSGENPCYENIDGSLEWRLDAATKLCCPTQYLKFEGLYFPVQRLVFYYLEYLVPSSLPQRIVYEFAKDESWTIRGSLTRKECDERKGTIEAAAKAVTAASKKDCEEKYIFLLSSPTNESKKLNSKNLLTYANNLFFSKQGQTKMSDRQIYWNDELFFIPLPPAGEVESFDRICVEISKTIRNCNKVHSKKINERREALRARSLAKQEELDLTPPESSPSTSTQIVTPPLGGNGNPPSTSGSSTKSTHNAPQEKSLVVPTLSGLAIGAAAGVLTYRRGLASTNRRIKELEEKLKFLTRVRGNEEEIKKIESQITKCKIVRAVVTAAITLAAGAGTGLLVGKFTQ